MGIKIRRLEFPSALAEGNVLPSKLSKKDGLPRNLTRFVSYRLASAFESTTARFQVTTHKETNQAIRSCH